MVSARKHPAVVVQKCQWCSRKIGASYKRLKGNKYTFDVVAQDVHQRAGKRYEDRYVMAQDGLEDS